MSAATLASYDEVPYTAFPFAQSHPSRLATMARLFGVDAPDVATARVLELGCAVGGNLIPMAISMPSASLIGIDLSIKQIERGRNVAEMLGLANLDLRHANIADIDASWGRFDYIIAHGIYSWVPAPIREKLLAICKENLAGNGVAFVSYNAMPGWGTRGVVRDAMLYHSRNAKSVPERIRLARDAIDVLARNLPKDAPYGGLMREVFESITDTTDAYINHDYLEEDNVAFYFHEFVAAARACGLEYLADAEFRSMAPQMPPELRDTLRRIAPDLIAREQYLDFINNRSFRQTLLVHSDVPINRRIEPRTMFQFQLASVIQPVSPSPSLEQGTVESFRTPSIADISTNSAICKAALIELGQRWPLAVPFHELVDAARARLGPGRPVVSRDEDVRMLAIEMLQSYAAAAIELRVWSPALAVVPGRRPVASPLARLLATRGDRVTNLLHTVITMNPVSLSLLPLLDGTNGRDALIRALAAKTSAGALTLPVRTEGLSAVVDETLAGLGKAGLLSA